MSCHHALPSCHVLMSCHPDIVPFYHMMSFRVFMSCHHAMPSWRVISCHHVMQDSVLLRVISSGDSFALVNSIIFIRNSFIWLILFPFELIIHSWFHAYLFRRPSWRVIESFVYTFCFRAARWRICPDLFTVFALDLKRDDFYRLLIHPDLRLCILYVFFEFSFAPFFLLARSNLFFIKFFFDIEK